MICFTNEHGKPCFVDIDAVCAISPAPSIPVRHIDWEGDDIFLKASYLMFSGGGTIHVEGSPTVVHKLIRDNKEYSDN